MPEVGRPASGDSYPFVYPLPVVTAWERAGKYIEIVLKVLIDWRKTATNGKEWEVTYIIQIPPSAPENRHAGGMSIFLF